ncbi:bifunctional 2-polyprenyl-6-hydroxyphenol methylase/3-demethylubiquinol 3-O-methyltransferase UbiG [Roseibium sp. MMSF_3412]|uniref:class I SAM-dependent methyltransferase n=1 Tax=Roseibium sp. MMSF_3412 TaxID=3046712 RepID=UPI00273D197B|nr:class I SAM-dependent methyltransferase [Roseibium sp. MMSF_3412]
MGSGKQALFLGGSDKERLYLKDDEFVSETGTRVVVKATDIPGVDIRDTVARHMARYFQLGLFCRPDLRVLDFPCGSGYAAEVLAPLHINYNGLDFDKTTVEYARRIYGRFRADYAVGDLCNPELAPESYDVVGCIEGLEHIRLDRQDRLIAALRDALVPGGVLVVSSPEARSGVSGPSADNTYHLGELTRADFLSLLSRHFDPDDIEVVTQEATLTTGFRNTCLFGICHKSA